MIPEIYQNQPLSVSSCLEVHSKFVQPFESSITRREIWDNFKKLINYIDNYNYLQYVDSMYLDGEFISKSANPDNLNILIQFDFNALLIRYGNLKDFKIWENDLDELCNTLFKRILVTTAFMNFDPTNPNLIKIREISEEIIKINLNLYTKVPNDSSRSKIYLILNNFDL